MSKNNSRKPTFDYPEGFLDDDLPRGALSPSSFNTYRRCPRQYCFSYVEEIVRPPKVVMFKGTMIHYGAEIIIKRYLENKQKMSIEEALDLVVDRFQEDKDEVESWEDTTESNVKSNIIDTIKVYHRCALPTLNPLAVEKTFMIKVGDVPVRGRIDLIDQVPGEYKLHDNPEEPPPLVKVAADLKTTTKIWPEQKVAYEPQFTFYAIAVDTEHVRADFILDQKKGIKYATIRALRSNNEKRILTEDVVDVSENIKRGIFPRCDPTGWNCTEKFCGYYSLCRGV